MSEDTKILKEIEEKIIKEITEYWEGKEVDYLTPALTDNYRKMLAGWYSNYSQELAEIDKRRAFVWLEIRKTVKSTKEADILYDQTEDGQRRIELKYKLKALEKNISALRDRLQRFQNESYNQY